MSRISKWAVKAGLAALVIATVAGCAQRRAPVVIPQGSPPPRAMQTQPLPQQRFPSVPPVRAYPRSQASPFERDTPSGIETAPLPDADYYDFGQPDFPSLAQRSAPRIAEAPRIKPPLPDSAPDLVTDPGTPPDQPRASDDYATLLDEDGNPRGGIGSNTEREAERGALEGRKFGDYPGAAAAGGPVLVALLVPETDKRGSVRALADGLAKAASLAAADFNESRLNLRKYDTGGEPGKAAEAARNAIADGAQLIIGPLFSGSAAAVRPVVQQAGVQAIAFTTDESVLGGGLYSIGFLPGTEIDRMISYAAARDLNQIAVFAPDTPYGKVVYDGTRAAAARSGATIARLQPFQPDFKALDSTAKQFASYYESNPDMDAILFATNGQMLQGLASYLAYNKVLPTTVKYMGLGLWDEKETFREGTLRGGWFPGVAPLLKSDFSGRYQSAYGGEPPSIAFLGYDAVAVAAALLREGADKPFSAQALQQPSGFTGMSGLFRFRRDGRNDRSLSILEVGRREFKVRDPAPRDFSGLAGG